MTMVKGTTFLLFLSPIAQAWSDHSRLLGRSLSHTRRAEAAGLPKGWASQGCYSDELETRIFSGANYTSDTAMTVNNCISFCDGKKMIYAGVGSGSNCYCDTTFNQVTTNASMSDCNLACTSVSLALYSWRLISTLFHMFSFPPICCLFIFGLTLTLYPALGSWVNQWR